MWPQILLKKSLLDEPSKQDIRVFFCPRRIESVREIHFFNSNIKSASVIFMDEVGGDTHILMLSVP